MTFLSKLSHMSCFVLKSLSPCILPAQCCHQSCGLLGSPRKRTANKLSPFPSSSSSPERAVDSSFDMYSTFMTSLALSLASRFIVVETFSTFKGFCSFCIKNSPFYSCKYYRGGACMWCVSVCGNHTHAVFGIYIYIYIGVAQDLNV